MERVAKFLKEASTYYLATMEGDQPRVGQVSVYRCGVCVFWYQSLTEDQSKVSSKMNYS